MTQSILLQAVVYLAAGVVFVPLAKRLGLGSVLGYLLAGMVIGPAGLGLVGAEGQDIMHVAEFGVVIMLFLVGLELEPGLLWKLRTPILGLGGLQVALTAVALGALALLLGLPWPAALATGLILAMSSTAIVLQTLNEKGLMPSTAGQSAFSVLSLPQDSVSQIVTVVVCVLGVVVVLGRFGMRPVFRAIARTDLREVFIAAALLLVGGVALLMETVGLSPALGAFVAGVVLANSEYKHELESDIDPFKGLLLGLFFISVGASVDFGLIAENPGTVAGVVVAVMAVKALVLGGLGRHFRLGTDQNLLFALSLAQVGEFAFVLLSFSVQNGILDAPTSGLLTAAVAITMALTPVLFAVNERLLLPRIGTRATPKPPADAIEEKNEVIVAGFGRFGNIVGRFLRANDVGTTVLDFDSDRVDILRKIGIKVYYGDASRYDLLRSAGAAEARLLVIALDTPEKSLELVETARKHFPNLRILVRANDRDDAYDLLDAGLNHVYRETLDSSLRMGVDALRRLGHRAYHAERSARLFRRHDEQALTELAAVRHDRRQYFSTARRRIRELEQLLRSDETDRWLRDIEEGWDAESLRKEANG